jgi:antitoxin (DNA-binding transcriptional repressor) of toxin-antitoxin stability system
MRKTASIRDLHLKTSEIVRQVAGGDTFTIEKQGTPVAEIRPLPSRPARRRLPNREKFISSLPMVKTDSGRILEEDR